MSPLEITETWEAVRPNFYDSNGCPVVNRQQEDGKGWDRVRDLEFSSSLFPQLPGACPCSEEVEKEYEEDSSVEGAAVAVACASTVTKKKTSGSESSSESSSGSDDDE